MQITVLKVNVLTEQGRKGPYEVAELMYKSDGQPKTTRVMGWVKDVFSVITAASAGDVLEVKFEKNDKGYWNLVAASATGTKEAVGATPTSGSSAGSSKGNWETSEERAHRQVMIARQSSLQRATEYFTLVGKKVTPDEVISLADEYVAYVVSGKQEAKKASRPKKEVVEQTGDVE